MEKNIIEEFKPYIIDGENEYYVKASVATQFVAVCSKHDLAVIYRKLTIFEHFS